MASHDMALAPAPMDWRGEVRYDGGQESGMSRSAAPPGTMSNYPGSGGESPYYHINYDQLRPQSWQRGDPDMTNPLTREEMADPKSNAEVYQASLKDLLGRNIGQYIVATFQMSGQGTVSVPGILYTVGNDYIVLYQPMDGRYVTGDLYSLKFVDFHDPQSVPEDYRRQE